MYVTRLGIEYDEMDLAEPFLSRPVGITHRSAGILPPLVLDWPT